jgi:hypothetical protein
MESFSRKSESILSFHAGSCPLVSSVTETYNEANSRKNGVMPVKFPSSAVSCDVLILGGGSAGAAASWAASGSGLKVVLAEKTGRLGGMATNGLVSTLCGCYSSVGERRKISGGARDTLASELKFLGGLNEGVNRESHRSDICDPELLACALDRMILRSGTELHFSTLVTGASFDGEELLSVETVDTESGTRTIILPKIAVDATGKALLASFAPSGAVLSPAGGKLQAGTMVFRMDGVDGDQAGKVTKDQIASLMADARAKGDITQERGNGVLTVLPCGTAAIVNANWVKADASIPGDVTRGLTGGREKVLENARFFQKYVPGFENAVLSCIAPALGVREASRTECDYTLTEKDIMEGRLFADAVCVGSWPMEYHDWEQNRLVYRWSGKDYTIPFRSLLPRGMNNVLAAGRNISVTPGAYASSRVMGQCLATGHAAGTAARLSLRSGILPRDLDRDLLRKTLMDEGAILE